jgi:hypothetical protein
MALAILGDMTRVSRNRTPMPMVNAIFHTLKTKKAI